MNKYLQKTKRFCALALCALMISVNCQPLHAHTISTVTQKGPGVHEPVMTTAAPAAGYLGGSKLTLVSNQTDSQILSAMIETNNGQIIMIDGGVPGDASYLARLLARKGGRVHAWLVTHPHSDHIGALQEILQHPEYGITVDHVYGSFLSKSWYLDYEPSRANVAGMFLDCLESLPDEKVHKKLEKDQKIQVDNVEITVMNQPYQLSSNAINNSSVVYKLDINGKKALFLGDLGSEGGKRLMCERSSEELKADIVQMAHHGQRGVNLDLYRQIQPEVCLWPTPDWLWDNNTGEGYDTAGFKTIETRRWMAGLNVPYHLAIKDGDQTIR